MWAWHVSIFPWDTSQPFRIEGYSWSNSYDVIWVGRFSNWSGVLSALAIVADKDDTVHIRAFQPVP